MSKMFDLNRVNNPFEVVYVSKEDGHYGASYRCSNFEKAEEAKRRMEEALGASVWDVVIIRH